MPSGFIGPVLPGVSRPRDPPIVIVATDRRLRAALRGRLLDHGRTIVELAHASAILPLVRTLSVRLIVVAHAALNDTGLRALDLVRATRPEVPILLLAPSSTGWPPGPWNAVIRDVTSPERIVAMIEWLLPLSPLEDVATMPS
jgi:hypothetical protein